MFNRYKKGGNAVAPVTSSQADSVSKTISDSLPVARYTGTWLDTATFGGGADAPPGPEYDINVSFVYCITNINNDSFRFWMQNPMMQFGFGYPIPIVGQFAINSSNIYAINSYSDHYMFKIINDSLYVNGYYYNGSIDNDYSGSATVSFAGKLQPYATAVQARQRKP